jgi:hypothetical protein
MRNVFLPTIAPAGFNGGEMVPSVGVGAQNFLQYDEVMGSAAMLLWALYVYLCNLKRVTLGNLVSTVSTTLGLTAMLGPVGAAVSLLWMRDEDILGLKEGENAAVSRKK